MTERPIISPEQTTSLAPLLYTVDAFATRMKEDPDFANKVAGCTTIGFAHFISGVNGANVRVRLYGEEGQENIFCQLHRDTYELTFGEKPYLYDEDFIEANQEFGYGERASWVETLMEATGFTYKELLIKVGTTIDNDLHVIFHGDEQDEAERKKIITMYIKKLGINKGNFEQIQQHFLQRKGIQIVYGNKEAFAAFLHENGAQSADDYAAEIRVEIPERFILAIIPLGTYEQYALGL